MKNGLTEIIAIIDESGSMSSIKTDVIGGFNQFVEEQKNVEGEAKLTLVLFDSIRYNVICESKNIKEFEGLNENNYRPGSMTPLLDAVGKTIKSAKKRIKDLNEDEKPERVIVAIQTDGLENASKEYTKEKIKEMIKKREDKGWLVVFLGANIDSFAEGAKIGIDKSKSLNWTADAAGVKFAYDNLSKVSKAYRSVSVELKGDVNFENADKMIDDANNKLIFI